MTSLKIILKGIADPADVLLAEEAGVDALWVSNHGGRQLDTAPATIEVLPAIRHEVNSTFIIYWGISSKMSIFIDGGVRQGSDIFKCLALGADFVFLGRGFLYSAVKGE